MIYKVIVEDPYENFHKNLFDFSIFSTKLKFYDSSNTHVLFKIKYAPTGLLIKRFVRLNSNIFSFLIDDSRKHKKIKV